MSRIGIGANVTQPDAKCMSCKYWKQAGKIRFGYGMSDNVQLDIARKIFGREVRKYENN